MRADPYDIGDTAVVTLTFTVDGVATDPTTASVDIVSPSGVPSTETPTKTDVGVYELALDCTEAGTWRLFGKGTGAAKCAQPYEIFVRAKPF